MPELGSAAALRLTEQIVAASVTIAREVSSAIANAQTSLNLCNQCMNITDGDVCPICVSPAREHRSICVVEQPHHVWDLEALAEYNGVYHVLHGRISPAKGVLAAHLKLRELFMTLTERRPVKLYLALENNLESRHTALYIQHMAQPLGVKCSSMQLNRPTIGQQLPRRRDAETVSERPPSKEPTNGIINMHACVVNTSPLGETSLLATLITESQGTIKIVVTNGKWTLIQPADKVAHATDQPEQTELEVDVLTLLTVNLRQLGSLPQVVSTTAARPFAPSDRVLERFVTASKMTELAQLFTPYQTPNQASFQLLSQSLPVVEKIDQIASFAQWYEMRLLDINGYLPQLTECVACGRPATKQQGYTFSGRDGGIRCQRCAHNREPDVTLNISPDTLAWLSALANTRWDKITTTSTSTNSMAIAARVLKTQILHSTGRCTKAEALIQEARSVYSAAGTSTSFGA